MTEVCFPVCASYQPDGFAFDSCDFSGANQDSRIARVIRNISTAAADAYRDLLQITPVLY